MARGWVYVMTNDAMPDLVKVGFTLKDADLRAKELSHTGVPGKWVVKFEAFVANPREVEQQAHKLLIEYSHSKEFFTCPVQVAIAALQEVSSWSYQLSNQEEFHIVDEENNVGNFAGVWFDSFTGNGFYEGQIVNGKRHGKGKFSDKFGMKYDGEWAENFFHGKGVLELDGERYEGVWVKGEFESGVVCKSIGQAEFYEGEWSSGERNGRGKLTGKLGETYYGDWKGGKRHGFGRQQYANGRVYEGEWSDDVENGAGKLTYPDGHSCEGEWCEGEFCGNCDEA